MHRYYINFQKSQFNREITKKEYEKSSISQKGKQRNTSRKVLKRIIRKQKNISVERM